MTVNVEKSNWNALICQFPQPHVLQTRQWAAVKEKFGWQPHRLVWVEKRNQLSMVFLQDLDNREGKVKAAAQVLERRLPLGLRVFYVPKGPLLKDWSDDRLRNQVLDDLEDFSRGTRPIQLKMDPDLVVGTGVPGKKDAEELPLGTALIDELKERAWIFSDEQIQYRNTVLVDLTADEDDLLAAMKSKTRYNIRLSGRKGVDVRLGTVDDLDTLYQMYASTAVRAGFTIRSETYYQTVWREFMERDAHPVVDPYAQPLLAEVDGQPVAGAVVFKFADRAWYIHGMSLLDHSEKMPSYAIQWESMRWARRVGCKVYDMWGAPDQFNQEDPMWGVYRFKNGFGGTVIRTIGAWDYSKRRPLYRLYHQVLPQLLGLMRRIRDQATVAEANTGL